MESVKGNPVRAFDKNRRVVNIKRKAAFVALFKNRVELNGANSNAELFCIESYLPLFERKRYAVKVRASIADRKPKLRIFNAEMHLPCKRNDFTLKGKLAFAANARNGKSQIL